MTTRNDPSTAAALAALTLPDAATDPDDRAAIDRRRFLGLVAAGAGAGLVAGPGTSLLGALPGLGDGSAWAAGPLGPDEGVLVVLGMFGGNDGLDTVVPIADGRYRDQRRRLALSAGDTIAIDGRTGLHPALTEVKRLWDAGEVAIVEGIGYPKQDFSHFNSMAWWMSGQVGGVPSSGWLGRWLDGHLGGRRDLFAAAEVGSGLPLHVRGRASQATVVPAGRPGFGASQDASDQAVYRAVRAMNTGAVDSWHGRIGRAFVDQLEVGARLGPVVPDDDALPDVEIVARAEVMARLINANVGFRVLTAGWGDFDSHAGQPAQHGDRMAELNAALRRFFEVLHPSWRTRVTMMTFSEFGRTSFGNDGAGTDHGSAAPHFVIGPHVRGGFYGQRPSLAGLGRWDRMPHHVDFRDYFGSVLDGWMGGGGSDVFGRTIDNLQLFNSGPGNGAAAIPGSVLSGGLVPIGSTRAVDTRDGTGAPARPVGPDQTLRAKVTGVGGVPANGVTAVIANVTLVRPSEGTHLRVFPGNGPRPGASTVNAPAWEAVPNLTVVPVAPDGTINVYNRAGNANCIVDVFAYLAGSGGSAYTPLAPSRVLDTRHGIGGRSGAVAAGDTIDVRITGEGGVPASGVTAVAVNLTATRATAGGYVIAWPSGTRRPATSNLNYVAGRSVANMAIVPVGADGRIRLFASGGTVDLLADVVGYFGAAGREFVAVHSRRLLDTRSGNGAAQAAVGAGREIEVQVAGRGGVPVGATAAVLNVTAVKPTGGTHLRIYPSGTSRPNASSLNVDAGATVANMAIVKLGTGGRVRVFNANGDVHVLADVIAYSR